MPIPTALRFQALGACLVFAACAGCQGATQLQYPLSAAQVSFAAPSAFSAQSGAGQDGNTSEVRTVFGEWVSARSQGNAAAYEGLYDPAHFEGIRRARSGIEKRMTWAEWGAEQRPGIERGEAPRVLRPVFESWPGGTLDMATASVAFDEDGTSVAVPGRGPRSGDVVQRVLVFGRGADNKLRIVREELGVAAVRGAGAPSNTLSRDAKVARALEN